MIFNREKVRKESNNWVEIVLETRFWKFEAISSKFLLVFHGFEVHIFVEWKLDTRFKIPVKLNLFTSPCLNSLILLLNFMLVILNSWLLTAEFNTQLLSSPNSTINCELLMTEKFTFTRNIFIVTCTNVWIEVDVWVTECFTNVKLF